MLGTTSMGVTFQVSIRLDMDEMTRLLTADQIRAVMLGIAKVLSVANPNQNQRKVNHETAIRHT